METIVVWLLSSFIGFNQYFRPIVYQPKVLFVETAQRLVAAKLSHNTQDNYAALFGETRILVEPRIEPKTLKNYKQTKKIIANAFRRESKLCKLGTVNSASCIFRH